MQKLIGYLRLMRLANIVTAVSDILAGIAIAAFAAIVSWNQLNSNAVLLLVISTIGLYGGGVVFNDVFDAELDKVERPERPIPSGLISGSLASLLGASLLILGIVSAAFVHDRFLSASFILAVAIAIAALVYDKWGKHHPVFGPVNMGICRGLNLLLGMSIIPGTIEVYWFLSFIPIVYIAAITMISRGEVHGGSRTILKAAVVFYVLVMLSILLMSLQNRTLLFTIGFLLLFAIFIFPPLFTAMKDPRGPLIGKAVKAGVISLIIMNASWAAAFGNIYLALVILLLLPLSLWMAKVFAVT